MKKFLIQTTFFLTCMAGVLVLLLVLQDTELIVGRKKLYVEKSTNKKYDLMVLGSSRALYTFNPNLYEGDKTIFNMGEEGQGFPSNYLMLKMFIEKHHIQIDKLLMEIDCYSFNGSRGFSRKFRDDFFVMDIDDPEVFEAYKKYRGVTFARTIKTFPKSANLIYCDFPHFVKYQVFTLKKFIPKLQERFIHNLHESAKTKGFKDVQPAKTIKTDTSNLVIEPDDLEYFEKLMALCKTHNIQVSFYRAPIKGCKMVQCQNTETYIDSFVKANNIPFYDYKCQYQQSNQYSNQSHPVGEISTAITKDILKKMGFVD